MFDNLSLLGLAPMLNLQLLLDGLLIGSVFALAAYGLALVWGVMNIKNLAQGDFVILGGYMAFTLSQPPINLHPILSIPIIFVLMFGFLVAKSQSRIPSWSHFCWHWWWHC